MHLRVRDNQTCTFLRYNANELPRARYEFRYVINNLSRTNFIPAFIYFYAKIAEAISEHFYFVILFLIFQLFYSQFKYTRVYTHHTFKEI